MGAGGYCEMIMVEVLFIVYVRFVMNGIDSGNAY